MSNTPKQRANIGAYWVNKEAVEQRLGRSVSRQYLQQIWLHENQLCTLCWKPLDAFSIELRRRMCCHCSNKKAQQERGIRGHEPWVFAKTGQKKKRGRPPLTNVIREGKPITTFELAMSRIDYSATNKEISAQYNVNIATVRKYRKIYHDKTLLLLQDVFGDATDETISPSNP
jgi:hypothetical protein